MNEKIYYSWNDIVLMCKRISDEILTDHFLVKRILIVSRGGFVPARLLSEMLGVKIIATTVSDIERYVPTIQVLVVDDISDTGKTLINATRSLGCSYKVATVIVRDGTHYEPNYYGERVFHSEWIEFPWETNNINATTNGGGDGRTNSFVSFAKKFNQ